MPWRKVQPVMIDVPRSPAMLCIHPYPGHPNGCPNYNRKPGCPPKAQMLANVLRLDMPVFAIWNVFDLASHVERMRAKHPTWSQRQLVCCLYWQPGARKALARELVTFCREAGGETSIIRCPEAMGVNITETMRQVGVELEWPPVSRAVQVALAGTIKTTV